MQKKNEEYFSILGHEIRTPLTSIRGYLSMILEGDMGEINNEVRKSLNYCYDSSIRLLKLTNDILALSKMQSGKMEYYKEKILLTDFLENIYDEVYIPIKDKKLEFEIRVEKGLKNTYIYEDKDKLKQVFINLIGNAIKFTNIGGKITLITQLDKDSIYFAIQDNGIGIPKSKQKQIFEEYSQINSKLTRSNNCGLGIGLALSYQFIKDFGSEIKVESELGKGSTFSFYLEKYID